MIERYSDFDMPKLMMKLPLWTRFLPIFLLAACSSAPKSTEPMVQADEQPAATPKAITKPTPPVAAEPDTNLSPEILFRLMLAEVAGQRGHISVAVQQYLEAAKISNDPKVIERATRIAVYARDSERAMQAAKLWVAVSPDSIEAHQVAAAMYVRQGDTQQAHHHLEKVITLSEGNRNTFLLITSLLSKERDKQVALNVMEQIVATRQDNPEALYAYSQLAVLVGDLTKAQLSIAKVIELRPDWADAHILQANTLFRQGKKVQALQQLKSTVAEYPKNIALRDYYARRLVDEKRYDEAQQEFEKLLDVAPDNADAIYALGLLALQTNDYDDANTMFERLVETKQHTSEASYYLGQIAEQQGKSDVAIKWYNNVRAGQYRDDAQIRIALIEVRQGEVDKARQRIRAIPAKTVKQQQRLLLAEGEILREAKQYQTAYELYTSGLKKLPDNPDLLYARALTAEKIELIEVTFSDLERIIQLEPDNAQALNALGYTLVDRTNRIKEGMTHIQKAYQLQPDDAAILDSLGWAHYRLGEHTEALKYLRMAFDKIKDAEIAAHLGEVLWVMGDQDQARDVWDAALRETPSHKLLLDVIKRFTE